MKLSKATLATWVSFVLAVVFLASSVALLVLYRSAQQERNELQKELDELKEIWTFVFRPSENYVGLGHLVIDGQEAQGVDVDIYSNSANLPLLEILKAIGYRVEWIDAYSAKITGNGKEYHLKLDGSGESKAVMTESGKDFNLLTSFLSGDAKTTRFFYEVRDKDIVLDSLNCRAILRNLGVNVTIDIDIQDMIVYVHMDNSADTNVSQ